MSMLTLDPDESVGSGHSRTRAPGLWIPRRAINMRCVADIPVKAHMIHFRDRSNKQVNT